MGLANGLAGRAWHPTAPEQSRPKPELKPLAQGGSTIIFAQKPNDHSLDVAHDHVQWIKDKLAQWPDAELRHHPLMCMHDQEPLDEALDRCWRAITYSSTVGAEAAIAGCFSIPESPGSMAWQHFSTSREQWLHELSWKQFSNTELATKDIAGYIISGFEEAHARAKRGFMQVPRNKLKSREACLRYHAAFGNRRLPTGVPYGYQ